MFYSEKARLRGLAFFAPTSGKNCKFESITLKTMEEDIRWKQRFANYEKALKQLTEALEQFGDNPININKRRHCASL